MKPKQKSSAGVKSWKKLISDTKEANRDPEFRKAVKEFIKYHSGRSS